MAEGSTSAGHLSQPQNKAAQGSSLFSTHEELEDRHVKVKCHWEMRINGDSHTGCQAFCEHSPPLLLWTSLLAEKHDQYPLERSTTFSRVRTSDFTGREATAVSSQPLTQPHRTSLHPAAALVASWHQHTKTNKAFHKQEIRTRKGGMQITPPIQPLSPKIKVLITPITFPFTEIIPPAHMKKCVQLLSVSL